MSKMLTVLARGLRRKCPKCGVGPLFEKWSWLYEKCLHCGWELRSRESNTWFFMYMSAAAITGIFVLLMLAVVPPSLPLGRLVVVLVALATFAATHSIRKGIGMAIEFLIDPDQK